MEKQLTSGINTADMDLTVLPGEDFFQYATGHWLDQHPANPEYPSWSNFAALTETTRLQLSELVQGIAAKPCEPGTSAQKVRDLYHLFMDTERLNREGQQPIQPLLQRVDACQTKEELLDFLASRHDGLFLGAGLGEDYRDSSRYLLYISPVIHNPENYLSQDPEVLKIAAIHREHDCNLLKLSGYPEDEAKRISDESWEIFTRLARRCMSLVDKRDPDKTCNARPITEIQELTPWFDWQHFLCTYGYDQSSEANFGDLDGILCACELYRDLPLSTLQSIVRLSLITESSGSLSDDLRDENYRYSQLLNGEYQRPPLWKRAVQRVVGLMGDVISQLYVEHYFPEENKQRMLLLVERLREAFAQRIQAQTWMSLETKSAALDKLASMTPKIGYPDKWEDLSGLQVNPALSYWDNVERISEFYWQLGKRKYYNKPVDKSEWGCSPETVNAFFDPTSNAITFPAAILQPPFFDMSTDDAANLGAIGAIIGHEMTHGYDDSGRKFDKEGNLREWWSAEDAEAFGKIAQQMSDFHDTLEALPGLKCNGKLTLGEDLADHGGITIAYQALQNLQQEHPLPVIDGLTPEQRFFLAYARNWAGFNSEESIRQSTLNDPHSTHRIRVNAALPHIDAWYEAFNILPTDPLFIEKEKRIRIW